MNNTIFYFFYNFAHQSKILEIIIIFFAVYFPYVVILLAAIFLLFHHEVLLAASPILEFKKKWKEIVMTFFCGIFAFILSSFFKLFFQSARPFDLFAFVNPLFTPSDYSFPSGHATFFFALAFSLFFSHKKIGYIFMIFAILISIARVVAGVHFPVDILGGFLLAYIISFFVNVLNINEYFSHNSIRRR